MTKKEKTLKVIDWLTRQNVFTGGCESDIRIHGELVVVVERNSEDNVLVTVYRLQDLPAWYDEAKSQLVELVDDVEDMPEWPADDDIVCMGHCDFGEWGEAFMGTEPQEVENELDKILGTETAK